MIRTYSDIRDDMLKLENGEEISLKHAKVALGQLIYTEFKYRNRLLRMLDAAENPSKIGSLCILAALRFTDFTRDEWFELFNVLYENKRLYDIFIWSHWMDKIDERMAAYEGAGPSAWKEYRLRILKAKKLERQREPAFKKELLEVLGASWKP